MERQRFLVAGTGTIDKDREIITSILHSAPDFWDRVHREPIENCLDTLTIDSVVNAGDVAEANRYHTANP